MSKKERFPLNLQFFAEPTPEPNPEPAPEPSPEPAPKEPTVQELMVEMAKLKKAQERAASEAAEYKKKYNATLSEKEKIDVEKAEKEAEKEERFKALERENHINKLEKGYLAMKYTADEASRMAVAEADGDLEAKMKIMAEVDARKQKEIEQEIRRSIPEPNFGVGNEEPTFTKEEFDKIVKTSGYNKLREIKEKYPETYKKYMQ